MRTEKDIRGACDRYIDAVVSGRRLANKYEKLAIQRHIDRMSAGDFPMNWGRVKKHVNFIELLPHVKGSWDSRTLVLIDWQMFCIADLIGWVNPATGAQLHREGYFAIPRKNAKTTLATGLGMGFLTIDGEMGPEVYSAATKKEQAGISWEIGRNMLRFEPELAKAFDINFPKGKYLGEIACGKNAGKFVALSSDSHTLDGLNVYYALIDEYHEHKDSSVYDVLITGTGARRQSMVLVITTAGFNLSSACYQHQQYCQDILTGKEQNDKLWTMIYTIDKDDDPFDLSIWEKANPNLGISFFHDILENAASKAQNNKRELTSFLTKHLNVWVNSADSWLEIKKWDQLMDSALSLEGIAGA